MALSNKVGNINDFIKNFNGGTRLNRFLLRAAGPGKLRVDAQYHCRATSIPGAYISAIGLNWFGRTIELPGERVYAPWSVTILDDFGTGEFYSEFEAWQHAIGNKDQYTFVNSPNAFASSITSAKGCDFIVEQYRADSDVTEKSFKIFNAWPISVGPIELDQSVDNKLVQFNVTFGYTHFDYL